MSVNALRKQSSDEEVIALAKSLIKSWKKLLGASQQPGRAGAPLSPSQSHLGRGLRALGGSAALQSQEGGEWRVSAGLGQEDREPPSQGRREGEEGEGPRGRKRREEEGGGGEEGGIAPQRVRGVGAASWGHGAAAASGLEPLLPVRGPSRQSADLCPGPPSGPCGLVAGGSRIPHEGPRETSVSGA